MTEQDVLERDIEKLLNLGKIKYHKEQDEALKIFDQIIELDPSNIDAWYYKGLLLELELKEYSLALKCYEKVLDLSPSDPRAHHRIHIRYQLQSNFKEAINHLIMIPDWSKNHEILHKFRIALYECRLYNDSPFESNVTITTASDLRTALQELQEVQQISKEELQDWCINKVTSRKIYWEKGNLVGEEYYDIEPDVDNLAITDPWNWGPHDPTKHFENIWKELHTEIHKILTFFDYTSRNPLE